jgi:hypothetical protein
MARCRMSGVACFRRIGERRLRMRRDARRISVGLGRRIADVHRAGRPLDPPPRGLSGRWFGSFGVARVWCGSPPRGGLANCRGAADCSPGERGFLRVGGHEWHRIDALGRSFGSRRRARWGLRRSQGSTAGDRARGCRPGSDSRGLRRNRARRRGRPGTSSLRRGLAV